MFIYYYKLTEVVQRFSSLLGCVPVIIKCIEQTLNSCNHMDLLLIDLMHFTFIL